MKIWLDDERPAPVGWLWVTTAAWAIALLHTDRVTTMSLDHDLGTPETGYHVCCWLEQHVADGGRLPVLLIHSANPVGRRNMALAIYSMITRFSGDRR